MSGKNNFLHRYQQLIKIPTISSLEESNDISNKLLIDLLANWLSDLGFKIEITPLAESRNKYNLLATYGEGEGGLLLSGHTDTVPFDDNKWHFDPFELTESNGRLYGLGAVDMKGFFAFVIEALSQIELKQLTKPIRILATADEETTMLGARHFAQHSHIRPDCAIIGEPTSLRPIYAHKGHLAQAIRITGKTGHSSDPDKGVNAIEIMAEATSHLVEMRNKLRLKYHNPLFKIPYPTMNFGSIYGGDAVNRICACCELQLDIRPLPHLPLADLDELLRESLSPLIERWGDCVEIRHLHPPIPGYECEHSSQVVTVLETLLDQKCEAVNYCTEAPFIQKLCPTIVLGAGSIEQAHQPNEYLDMKFIKPTHKLLTDLIHYFCG
ncbi:acetylornithine deacetylase [Pasteurella skyensis]|uniref:Acetylornithine deacetylase n=1 Tax=Phocoenobacter skyensis TaxID=97481 RepID=A0AAJ6N8K9_9PAST|nr:acetylornithine deacetylase [Pasteurella skyensis]MDP8162060.1 acetylornithine deacetylase [Pasteurella skyensis]MDP8172216.1 acetylornithine deacetylase [Pasteurella skyensis]MDP8176435.1 acetylornithine deacetylase [Pasteurella skyensis]MDP8178324.1 acetylornithine deacetylase [Pasteurella skyensis]MDP8182920.1 acetylornithine deacetylase [Pasteurella skyensis]